MKAVLSARSLKSSAPVDVIHYHLQPSDRQLNGYSSTGFFVRGLVILWTACLLKREYCPYLSVPLRELGQRRHTDIVQFALFSFFFLNGEEKYLFSNLDSSLSLVCINMLFVIKSLFFFFLFVHPVSQANANTPNNALNVPHV